MDWHAHWRGILLTSGALGLVAPIQALATVPAGVAAAALVGVAARPVQVRAETPVLRLGADRRSLSGRLLDSSGAPVGGARVEAEVPGRPHDITDTEGRFELVGSRSDGDWDQCWVAVSLGRSLPLRALMRAGVEANSLTWPDTVTLACALDTSARPPGADSGAVELVAFRTPDLEQGPRYVLGATSDAVSELSIPLACDRAWYLYARTSWGVSEPVSLNALVAAGDGATLSLAAYVEPQLHLVGLAERAREGLHPRVQLRFRGFAESLPVGFGEPVRSGGSLDLSVPASQDDLSLTRGQRADWVERHAPLPGGVYDLWYVDDLREARIVQGWVAGHAPAGRYELQAVLESADPAAALAVAEARREQAAPPALDEVARRLQVLAPQALALRAERLDLARAEQQAIQVELSNREPWVELVEGTYLLEAQGANLAPARALAHVEAGSDGLSWQANLGASAGLAGPLRLEGELVRRGQLSARPAASRRSSPAIHGLAGSAQVVQGRIGRLAVPAGPVILELVDLQRRRAASVTVDVVPDELNLLPAFELAEPLFAVQLPRHLDEEVVLWVQRDDGWLVPVPRFGDTLFLREGRQRLLHLAASGTGLEELVATVGASGVASW